jgi:uncharacterized protein (TIGR02231 family)
MKIVQPSESFDLNLGVDSSIKVERKRISEKIEQTGFIGDNRRTNFSYEITLTNLKKTPQSIVVIERLPISQHEKIKVELQKPRDLKPDEDGKLNWKLTLQPAEKKTIELSYWVEWPKKMQVQGL